MPRTLLDKVWEAHTVAELPSGQTQLFIGLHLVHEVTSPQAFQMLRELGLHGARSPSARSPPSTTSSRPTPQPRPFDDEQAEGDDARDRAQLPRVRHHASSTAPAGIRASST